tara:strand:- start:3462 stop:3878 length:417 start_codon:yes stop_codon:yes gene_type:complete
MNWLASFIAGFIFALGLVISGMTNPDKVIGFLDLFGDWDYALAFVMAGAVLFNLLTFHWLKRRQSPLFSDTFHWPTKKDIDKRLVIGASFFGLGWGLLGICPGPGLVNLVTMNAKLLVFVAAMLAGMLAFKIFDKMKT